jgi:predicted dehydrogenase
VAGDKLRFAIVGCGRMGRRRARTIVEHPMARLVCVADVNERDAREIASEHDVPHYSTYAEVVARPDVDCVVVAVPNKWHLETVVASVEAGKHVLCEKPLARNPDEARAMVAAADRAGKTLKTGSNLRFFPSLLKAKELLDAHAIGDLLFLRSWIGHDGWVQQRWFADPDVSGGGTFLDNGCHVLDIARWFMGEVRSCTGVLQTGLWPVQPLEDNGFGIFEMAGGTATIQASWTEWAGYMYMEVYGKEGFIRIDNRGASCRTTLGDRFGKEEVFDFSAEPADSYQREMDAYVHAIQAGRQPLPSGSDGMRAVEMAWSVYESARTGRKVAL